MSVHVTVMPAAIPHSLRDQKPTRTIGFNDTSSTKYVFEVLPSGALVVWKGEPGPDADSEIEVIYGPAAWENVQGATRPSFL
jgi:hypothetical protein